MKVSNMYHGLDLPALSAYFPKIGIRRKLGMKVSQPNLRHSPTKPRRCGARYAYSKRWEARRSKSVGRIPPAREKRQLSEPATLPPRALRRRTHSSGAIL